MGTINEEHLKNGLEQLPESENEPADFQKAISATMFGKFNFILIAVAAPATLAVMCETAIMSFIIPTAGCDLGMTPNQKGLLNSMAFAGMVISGFIWGFLLDTLGRKKMLFLGYTASAIVVLGKSLSTHIALLYFFQFCGGSLTGGLYIATNTYLHEFHSTVYRGRIQMIYGSLFCIANILIPLMSSGIIGIEFDVSIGPIKYFSWNLLLFISAMPSLTTATAFYFLPETPKYLMSCGNNEEALKVLRQIYRINTGEKPDNYPIKKLISETTEKKRPSTEKSWLKYLKLGFKQISPLFGREYILKLILVCSTQAMYQVVLSTLRLYTPQIFQADHDYKIAYNKEGTLCDILTILRAPSDEEEDVCLVNLENNFMVYFNSIVIAAVSLVAYIMAGTLINLFGRKNLLHILNLLGTLSVGCLYFSTNMITTLVLSSAFFACISICFDIFVTIVVVLFPTTLRAMAFSWSLLFGRALIIFGNVVVPMLVEIGCAPPFIGWSAVTLTALILTCLIPNTDKMDMK